MFKIGDAVEWTSSNTKKIGVVTHIVGAGQIPSDVGVSMESGMSRDHDTYILRGSPIDWRGAPMRRKAYYWPHVSLIKPLGAVTAACMDRIAELKGAGA